MDIRCAFTSTVKVLASFPLSALHPSKVTDARAVETSLTTLHPPVHLPCVDMSASKNLRIAGIFITMAASVLGFAIPYIRGAPKNHSDAVSTSWMSIKAFSAGVILSVAFVHLLGEALEVLGEIEAAELAAEIAAEEAAGGPHEEEEEGHGHKSFPWGITLCLAGAAMTLGIELIAGIFINRHQTSNESTGEVQLTQVQKDNNNNGTTTKICDDPYRLEHGHSHHKHEDIHCHAEHEECSNNASAKETIYGTGKISPESSAKALTMDHGHAHVHDHESCTFDLNKTDNLDIHRHVSIVVEDVNKSILKSLLLEGAIACHSIIIGIMLGGTDDYKTLGVLLAAFAFHQFFEGISLGSASLQAAYSPRVAVAFLLVFALSVPLGMLIGLNVPATTQGQKIQAWFSCIAAGSLIYTAMVEMVAEDFAHLVHTHSSHGQFQGGKPVVKRISTADQVKAMYMYLAFVAGLASMTVLANWA